MPILSQVGRRSPGQRAARTVFYLLLFTGSVAVVYPLLLVVGQSMADRFDLRDNAIVPRYLYDDTELALKHIFGTTRKLPWLASRHHRNRWTTHPDMRADAGFLDDLRATVVEQGFDRTRAAPVLCDYSDFKRTLGPGDLQVKSFRIEDYYRPFLRRRYRQRADALEPVRQGSAEAPAWLQQVVPEVRERNRVLRDRDRLAVAVMNHEFRADYANVFAVEVILPGNVTVPVWRPRDEPKMRMWRDFLASVPPEQLWVVNSDTYWHDYLRRRYNDRIADLNAAWGTRHGGFFELRLPFMPPEHPAVLADWERFMVKRWPRRLLRIPHRFAPQWREFLRERVAARLPSAATEADMRAELARLGGPPVSSWDQVRLPERWPEVCATAIDTETAAAGRGTDRRAAEVGSHRDRGRAYARLWAEFSCTGIVPAESMLLDAPELRFRQFLTSRYGQGRAGVAALNDAWGTSFGSVAEVPLPVELADLTAVTSSVTALRLSHAVESFERVWEYLTGRGRALTNTLILIVLSLFSALTINPLAAYSLSRFSMKQAHKILIYFLATMAFPAEVTMIPNFLLLRDLVLLNTFAALVLPTMANGFSIFLLKCFFDSLPKELYEAADIDGAGELQCFRLVALPLIKPILAYIALGTFVLAYGSFMWAFVICPDPRMWTLMVWVFDFQSRNPGANYVMASVLLVSVPPLLVFLVANRVIMRGIMIPQMK